jgi:hypothetical protein
MMTADESSAMVRARSANAAGKNLIRGTPRSTKEPLAGDLAVPCAQVVKPYKFRCAGGLANHQPPAVPGAPRGQATSGREPD